MVYLKNTVIAIIAAVLIAVMTGSAAYASGQPTTESKVAKTYAPSEDTGKKKWSCRNYLAQSLYAAGFRGKKLRIAWAISMRESGGNPKSVSSTHDYGVFQLNRAAWHKAAWWDTKKLLTATYNIAIAYQLSQGGHTFYPWDISGNGAHIGHYTSVYTYRKFTSFYDKFPCVA